MHRRPLALVGVLTALDYALWHWSLNANQDVLALLSGLTLLPLVAVSVVGLAGAFARLLARTGPPQAGRLTSRRVRVSARAPRNAPASAEAAPAPGSAARAGDPSVSAPVAGESSRKLAA